MTAQRRARPSTLPPSPPRTAPAIAPPSGARWSWPGLCCVCGRWQAHTVCHDCLTRWRPQADAGLNRCRRCALPWMSAQGAMHCRACEAGTPEFDRAIAALDYVAPWSHLIARLKYQRDIGLVRPLASLLADAVRRHPHRVDLVLPVPQSGTRTRERGFNQAWLLARDLSRQLNLPARDGMVSRSDHHAARRLAGLDAPDRRVAVQGAFEIAPDAARHLRSRHVAVVDDVLTTGATLNELSRVLQAAGVRSISAWVVARTPDPGGVH